MTNVAITNQNGVIDYSQNKGKLDSSLKTPLTSTIPEKQEVSLQANENKVANFKLKMPKEAYFGDVFWWVLHL